MTQILATYRLYLCRPQLLSNPQTNAPWQKLFATRDDCAFMTTMGISTNTFDFILRAAFASLLPVKIQIGYSLTSRRTT